MEHKSHSILLNVQAGHDLDNEDLYEISHLLIEELKDLDDVYQVSQAFTNDLPQGAKGAAVDFRSILITLAEGGGFTALASLLSSWLSRDRRRSIKLSIGNNSLELTGLSQIEQGELVKWFQLQTGLKL